MLVKELILLLLNLENQNKEIKISDNYYSPTEIVDITESEDCYIL